MPVLSGLTPLELKPGGGREAMLTYIDAPQTPREGGGGGTRELHATRDAVCNVISLCDLDSEGIRMCKMFVVT